MTEHVVDDFDWMAVEAPQCCTYVAPKILQILKRLKVRRVLDLGAGNGALCGQLAAQGYETVGVEYYAGGVVSARHAYPDIPFYQLGVQDDPARLMDMEYPFDAVVSSEVIEHLYCPDLLPQFASGVMPKGAYLILTTPYHGYLKNLALSLTDSWDTHFTPMWRGGHIKFWSRKTLTALLADNGFEVVSFHGAGRLPYLWKSMVLVARKL